MKNNGQNSSQPDTLILSRDEIIQRLEDGARRRLHISATELVRRYRARRLEDPGSVADLLALANLLPDDDPLFGNAAA